MKIPVALQLGAASLNAASEKTQCISSWENSWTVIKTVPELIGFAHKLTKHDPTRFPETRSTAHALLDLWLDMRYTNSKSNRASKLHPDCMLDGDCSDHDEYDD